MLLDDATLTDEEMAADWESFEDRPRGLTMSSRTPFQTVMNKNTSREERNSAIDSLDERNETTQLHVIIVGATTSSTGSNPYPSTNDVRISIVINFEIGRHNSY